MMAKTHGFAPYKLLGVNRGITKRYMRKLLKKKPDMGALELAQEAYRNWAVDNMNFAFDIASEVISEFFAERAAKQF